MTSTASAIPSSFDHVDHGTLSASTALAWKFYAFGMLAITVTIILGTVIYLGCFRPKKPTASRGDIEANEKSKATDELEHMQTRDKYMSSASTLPKSPLPSESVTPISTPPKARTATRGEGHPREPRGTYTGPR